MEAENHILIYFLFIYFFLPLKDMGELRSARRRVPAMPHLVSRLNETSIWVKMCLRTQRCAAGELRD